MNYPPLSSLSGGGGTGGHGRVVAQGTSALDYALRRAQSGLDWSYPCLVWATDYVRDETGRDPAAQWRGTEWNEATAKHELGRLAVEGQGITAVDRAMDALAKRNGWTETDTPKQGAIMLGVYEAADGIGVPAIFDGDRRWIVSNDGLGWTTLHAKPKRMWEISR